MSMVWCLLDDRFRDPSRAPAAATLELTVCDTCQPSGPRAQRCEECPLTRLEDHRYPKHGRLVPVEVEHLGAAS
jgi:hypothetical protein